MFNEAETLKWVNAYREEFGLPLLDQLPAGQKHAGGKACMMGTATPGIIWRGHREVRIFGQYMELPEVAAEAERAFENYELPERFYHGDSKTSIAAMDEADRIEELMTPAIIERLKAKLSRNAWEKAEA
jgi:hypothetical protein